MTKRPNTYLLEPPLNKLIHLNNQSAYPTNPNLTYSTKANTPQQKGSPIQYQTFQHIFKGKDILVRYRPGSGKTLAYALPIISKFRSTNIFLDQKLPKLLVILPRRQLAIQVATQIESLKINNDFDVIALYGSTDINQQIWKLKQGCDIIVSTPGRLLDLITKNAVKLNKLQVVCLDEADKMSKEDFQQDLSSIFKHIYKHTYKTQNLLFSATIPPFVTELSQKYLSPNFINLDLIKNTPLKTSKTIQHYCICCGSEERNLYIGNIIGGHAGKSTRTIIFCQTKRQANQLSYKLKSGRSVEALHGNISLSRRQTIFQQFKNGKLECLVATNVSAKGLDFPQIDLIIHLEPPKDIDFYIYRSSRLGRPGKTGKSFTFYNQDQEHLIRKIQKSAKITFNKVTLPQSEEIYQPTHHQLQNSKECYQSIKMQNIYDRRYRTNDLHIFIGSLSSITTQSDLENFFDNNRIIVNHIRVLKDDKGQSKCVAFGECQDLDHFNKALNLTNQILNSSRILIKPAKKQI